MSTSSPRGPSTWFSLKTLCAPALPHCSFHSWCPPGRHRDWDPLSTSLAPRVLLLYSSHFKSWQIWQAKYSVWSHVAFAELLVRYNVFPYVCNSFWITFSPHFPIGVTGHIGSDRKTPFPDKGIILSREKQKAKPTPVNTKAEGQDFSSVIEGKVCWPANNGANATFGQQCILKTIRKVTLSEAMAIHNVLLVAWPLSPQIWLCC